MSMRILVVYASKYGATAEIAEKIGETLRENNLRTYVEPIRCVASIEEYGAVILGSAVYAGSWRPEAVKFLEQNEALLKERLTWFFSSGPTGRGDASQLMKGWRFPTAQQPIADRIQPRDIALFHGALDTNKLNFVEKVLIKGVKAPLGDFRDWDAVRHFAVSIAAIVQETATTNPLYG